MEVPGMVSFYCSLVDAKGQVAKLIAVNSEGFYHLEVTVKGGTHTMFVPVAQTALYFAKPEPNIESDSSFEVER